MTGNYQLYRNPNAEPTFFVGTEVERTIAIGHRTLFVAGNHEYQSIVDKFYELNTDDKPICHIFLAANQTWHSVRPSVWVDHINRLLRDFPCLYVTIDIPVDVYFSNQEWFKERLKLVNEERFILMLNLKCPNLASVPQNTYLKIDDDVTSVTNPGVWVHSINRLNNRAYFTAWGDYKDDKNV